MLNVSGNCATFRWTADEDVGVNQPVQSGALPGLTTQDVVTDEEVVCVRQGVFSLAKVDGEAWTQGGELFLEADRTLTTNFPAGAAQGATVYVWGFVHRSADAAVLEGDAEIAPAGLARVVP